MNARALIISAMLLVPAAASAESEKQSLKDGREIMAYRSEDVPKEFMPPKKGDYSCDRYVFLGDGFTNVLPDGRYETEKDSRIFLINAGCMHPYLGALALEGGKEAEFYQSDTFNTDGNLAAYKGEATLLPTGEHTLRSGNKFNIKDGYTEHDVQFNDGRLMKIDKE